MNSSSENSWTPDASSCYFSEIYIERSAHDYPMAARILSHFPDTPVHEIRDYRDVFYHGEDASRALILAVRQDHYLFPGAPVCQDFNEDRFTYASGAMNCLYDCEYCYLKGMYPSRHMVIFVNPGDTFDEIRRQLKYAPLYVCISYDTDLLAIEGLTGLVTAWSEFARSESELRVECRTKCASAGFWRSLPPSENFIVAYTLSPLHISRAFEHRTPPLDARLDAVSAALDAGHPVRLCLDPLIYTQNWQAEYGALLDTLTERVELTRIRDFSVGSFRISKDYLQRMRRMMPDSQVVQFPFDLCDGVYGYPVWLRDKMQEFVISRLTRHVPSERIFTI